MNVSEILNNREIAILVWLLIVSLYIFRSRDVRKSLASVFETVFSGKILIPVLILAVYMGGIAYFLSHLKLWNVTLLKDTLFWFFSAGMVTMYKYVAVKNGDIPIRELLYDNMKVIVVLEFIMNTFTFVLWAELVIVPVITVVVMMNVYIEATKGDRDVAKLLGGTQAVLGLVLMGHVLYRAVHDYQILGTLDTLRSFLLPILLSAAIIPAAYLMAIYSNYESLFIGFKFGKDKSQGFVNYCKLVILWNCGFSTKKISKLKPFDLMHLQNKKDVKDMFRKLDGDDVELNSLEQ